MTSFEARSTSQGQMPPLLRRTKFKMEQRSGTFAPVAAYPDGVIPTSVTSHISIAMETTLIVYSRHSAVWTDSQASFPL